jgi:hypothetical protein
METAPSACFRSVLLYFVTARNGLIKGTMAPRSAASVIRRNRRRTAKRRRLCACCCCDPALSLMEYWAKTVASKTGASLSLVRLQNQ